jgi:AhpD family alkylhydroperoxidase
MTDFLKIAEELSQGYGDLAQTAPGAMAGFAQMREGALQPGAICGRAKSLIALSIAVAMRCDGCIVSYAKLAIEAGASREQVAEALGVAVLMGGSPSVVYSARALAAYDQLAKNAFSGQRGPASTS